MLCVVKGFGGLKKFATQCYVFYTRVDTPNDLCRALLEIRHGDDLHQVARWHCDRHGLGPEKISVLSTKLEKVTRVGRASVACFSLVVGFVARGRGARHAFLW